MTQTLILAADIGGTFMKFGLFEESGKLIHRWKIPTNTADFGSNILSDLVSELRRVFSEEGLNPINLKAVGLGVPGPVTGGHIVNGCVNLGWKRVDLSEECLPLLKKAGFPDVRVSGLNDANAAALGEFNRGDVPGCDLVMITIGTGIGCGIILDGKLREGAFGSAGEIGHLMVNPSETKVCRCGKKGCLEQYAAAECIRRKVLKRLHLPDNALTHKELPPLVLEDVKEAGEMLGRALAAISCAVDPGLFVIGGGVSESGDTILEPIRESFLKHSFHASHDATVRLASQRNDAGMYGAFYAALATLKNSRTTEK